MSDAHAMASDTQAGTLEQALANGRLMLAERPDMALAQAHAILRRERRNPDALRLAAAAHRALGEPDQAERAELSAIQHSQTIPALVAAAKALNEGRADEASRLAAAHLQATPDDLAALTLSAESALTFGLADRAEELLQAVLARAPAFAHANRLMISALMRQDKLRESRARVQGILDEQPKDVTALRLLARIDSDLGDHEGAARTYEQLLKMADDATDLWILYADTLRFLGRPVESRLAYGRALSIDPALGQAWWSIVNLDPANVGKDEIEAMEKALSERSDQAEHAGNLHFALGTALDANGRFAEAFAHFAAGNALARTAQPYDFKEISSQIDRYVESLPAGSLPARTAPTAATPIFIVGMPRSGSTLVERILGRHSLVEPLGELPVIPHIVEWLKLRENEGTLEQRIAGLNPAELQVLADRYCDRAGERRRTDRPFFTDKLHMNWRHLALILRMLPAACVIDVRRSALDCCWSNYKLLFARGHPAAADLGDLGHFYSDYVRFMDHLERIAPGRIHAVGYERLVDDVEGETRRMLDFVGLPFEPQCLDFHLSRAPVATASSEQVRRPLNRESIGSWRPYSQWLDRLRDALGPLAQS